MSEMSKQYIQLIPEKQGVIFTGEKKLLEYKLTSISMSKYDDVSQYENII